MKGCFWRPNNISTDFDLANLTNHPCRAYQKSLREMGLGDTHITPGIHYYNHS